MSAGEWCFQRHWALGHHGDVFLPSDLRCFPFPLASLTLECLRIRSGFDAKACEAADGLLVLGLLVLSHRSVET